MIEVQHDEKNGRLIITIDTQKPTPSMSGKTLVIASSRGNVKTSATCNGAPIVIGLNAYIHR